MKKKIYDEEVIKLFNEGNNSIEISKILSCNTTSIRNILNKHNFHLSSKFSAKNIDTNLLLYKFNNENMKVSELARFFGCTMTAIIFNLKKLGVDTQKNKKKKSEITKIELENIYKTKIPLEEIAEHFNCHKSTIALKIKKFGIENNLKKIYYLPNCGDKINDLTFIREIKENKKRTMWECECVCGEKIIRNAKDIISGRIKSCGCLVGRKIVERLKKNNKWRKYEDISGKFWIALKQSAKVRNHEFKITIKYIWDLFIKQNKRCSLSNLPLNFEKKEGTFYPSLDRIDSNFGYIEGNVQWTCKEINMMKWKLKQEDFLFFCKQIIKNKNL